jgi:NAD-dependent dihydropyrimidine dehydrogenase PreA subunit
LCPFGGIEGAFTLILTGSLLVKIAWSSFILLAATIVVALVFRRVFCGKICAFGALQELFGRLGKAMFRKSLTVPAAIDKPARYLKYLTLAAIVILSAVAGQLIIRPYDPWAAWNHLLSVELISGFLVGLIILIVSLVGSLLYDRFFCKYLCPMGGFLGLINRLGWFRVKRNDATCTHCMACNKACPVKDTLVVGGPRKGKVPSLAVLGISIAVFVAVVVAGSLIGGVQWTQKPLAATGEETVFNPDDIKGSDTFKAVSEVTGIPMEAFITAFGITPEELGKPIKDSAHKEGSTFDTEAVREFVRGKLK